VSHPNPINDAAAAALMRMTDPAGGARQFAYDAVEDRGRRKAIFPITRSEDKELLQVQRRTLISGARDLPRNFTIAAWAIRKHLDYVSSFKFQANTGNDELDDAIELAIAGYSAAENCDVAGRHSLPRLVRMLEQARTVDGDVFLNLLDDGRLQAIEGDRVRTPTTGFPDGVSADKLTHGVLTDDYGKALGYAVCRRPRNQSDLVFESMLSPLYCRQLGYFSRIDQVRGVSPLAPAINSFRDVYEGIDYALAKAKVSQFLGLVTFRKAPDEIGITDTTFGGGATVQGEDDVDEEPRYDVDIGRGPLHLDLDPGDDAKILQDSNPSTQFQQFTQEVIVVALKSLDIPGCFYDEGRANFSSGRQGWILYDQSAQNKRADLRELLDFMTAWLIRRWVIEGSLVLPRGMRLEQVRWEWIHAGIPWVDPLKEITADAMAINSGMDCRTDLLKAQGKNYFDVIDKLAAEKAYAKSKGIEFSETPFSVVVNAGDGAPQEQGNAAGK
jgi:capsid protein